ncbi:energy-coupling factor transporter transmembrane component T family protein [Curtanaerobium respiraculi]|uniref:energy-coupling factor transporter transmembrane component T family protein n=1 Tax=Curtanaerobium respiraculi TaxID=2949669 RepID=UPI0024B3ABF9|nr:energy-coupling factor transporter transmembrane component T [Curtanaerobium respiraculi]
MGVNATTVRGAVSADSPLCDAIGGEGTARGFISERDTLLMTAPDRVAAQSPAIAPTVRRFDPRAALAVLILLNVQVALYPNLAFQVAAMGVSVAAMLFCGRLRAALGWTVAYLVVFALVTLGSLDGMAWLTGFISMLVMFQRVFPAAAFAMNCIATTRTGEFGCALQMARVPSHLIVSLCVALRFLPSLRREFKAVFEAMKIRGLISSPLDALLHPARIVERIMVPVIGRVGIIADELGNAVVARGADTDRRRSSYYALRIGVPDAALIAAEVTLVAAEVAVKSGVIA